MGGLWALGMARRGSSRKQRSQSYNHKELHSANNTNEQGNGFSPEPPDRKIPTGQMTYRTARWYIGLL